MSRRKSLGAAGAGQSGQPGRMRRASVQSHCHLEDVFCVLEDFVRILQINLNVFPSLDHLSPGQLVNQSWPPSALGWSLLAAEPGPER